MRVHQADKQYTESATPTDIAMPADSCLLIPARLGQRHQLLPTRNKRKERSVISEREIGNTAVVAASLLAKPSACHAHPDSKYADQNVDRRRRFETPAIHRIIRQRNRPAASGGSCKYRDRRRHQ